MIEKELNKLLVELGINEIISNGGGITDIAINRPKEIWIKKNGDWAKIEKPQMDFLILMDFAEKFAKYNNSEIGLGNAICDGVLPNGLKCIVIVPPAVESNTIAVTINC